MKLYKLLAFSLISILMIINIFPQSALAANEPPSLNSEGAALLDANTGQVVYGKNADTRYFPASTTKILTALIVIEKCNLDETVKIGKNPPFADGTSIGLREGEVYTVKELLTGLLLESGNDCACALAEHVSGSNEEFAKLMNARAKELGATNSNFKNPSGLPDDEHYTTPKDLALIMRACNNNPQFVAISRTKALDFQASTIDGYIRKTTNHNLILFPESNYYYKYSVASKKGYTTVAQFTNVISATKNGKTYIASFLKGEGMTQVYRDVALLFNYGFDCFEDRKICSEGEEVGSFTLDDGTTIPLLAEEDVYYTVPIGSSKVLDSSVKVDTPSDYNEKSIQRGDVITTGNVIVENNTLKKINLVSGVNRVYEDKLINSNSFIDNNKYTLGVTFAVILMLAVRIFNVKRRKAKYLKKRQASNLSKKINSSKKASL